MLRKMLFIGPVSEALESVRRIAREVVASAALEVRDPASGRPGREFPWAAYDVVFLSYDLGLPRESGLAWLRGIMADSIGSRVVLLANMGHNLVRDSAIDLGASACLPTDDGNKSLTDWLVNLRDDIARHADTTLPSSGMLRGSAAASRSKDVALTDSGASIRIPGYTMERLLARGGMAAIYIARQAAADLKVACKVLDVQNDLDPEFLSRFMREYATLADLDHPHVIRIFERGFAKDFAYIAMELCPLGDLKAQVNRVGIGPDTALDYIDQIAQGLGAAHAIGIVHRDVKPSNILLRDKDTLVVTDFGVARDTARNTRITREQAIVGTPLYVSPEQIEGREPDGRCDLYSLGAMLYEMLTGVPPYQSDSRVALLGLHVTSPIPQLPSRLGRFQPLIDGLLAKDPDDRFQSTQELRQGIDWIRQSMS